MLCPMAPAKQPRQVTVSPSPHLMHHHCHELGSAQCGGLILAEGTAAKCQLGTKLYPLLGTGRLHPPLARASHVGLQSCTDGGRSAGMGQPRSVPVAALSPPSTGGQGGAIGLGVPLLCCGVLQVKLMGL